MTAGEKLLLRLIRNSSTGFDPSHFSKGLEFPVVALVGAGRMPAEGEDEREEARLFYVGATRAKQRLVIGASGEGLFGIKLSTTGGISFGGENGRLS